MSAKFTFPALSQTAAARLGSAIAEDTPRLVAQRRAFHADPELGWREIRTTAAIVSDLVAAGYQVISGRDFLGETPRAGLSADPIPGEGETGCIALYDTGRPGPTVCMRVDIDALPITESTGGNHAPAAQGFASGNPGAMHACGHDGHAAIGLATARALGPLLDHGRGRLKLLFQPAEEGGRGGRAVADAGWMDDVDLFFAIHLGLGLPSDHAAFAVRGLLAITRLDVVLEGRATHAGKTPENGRNALLAACQMVPALLSLGQSSRPGIRVNVGLMQAGSASNIVPDRATFTVEFRAEESADLDALVARARALIEGTAAAHGIGAAITPGTSVEGFATPESVAHWAGGVNASAGAFGTTLPDMFFGASEDAATLARRVEARGGTGGVFMLGADIADDHHTPAFDFDEGALPKAALLCAGLVAAAMEIDPA